MPFSGYAILQVSASETRLGDFPQEEIAENGDALGMPQFLGICEIHIGRADIELRQDHVDLGRLARQVVRQRSNPQPALILAAFKFTDFEL